MHLGTTRTRRYLQMFAERQPKGAIHPQMRHAFASVGLRSNRSIIVTKTKVLRKIRRDLCNQCSTRCV